MCGIVGIFDKNIKAHSISERLCTALHFIEYRGYDSCGVAMFSSFEDIQPQLIKTVGEVKKLEMKLASSYYSSNEVSRYNIGIAHTRWATHGVVTESNAHPINVNDIYMVHNGVLENYLTLKSTLASDYQFSSGTDTEVIAALLDKEMKVSETPVAAAIATLNYLKGIGSYIAVSHRYSVMIVVCIGTPMIIGKTDDDDFYVVSDILAFPHTVTSTYHMKTDEVFCISNSERILYSKQRNGFISMDLLPFKAENITQSELGTYSTHTEKEIYEQVKIVQSIHLDIKQKLLTLNMDITQYDEIVMIGCGSSFNACNIIKELILERGISCIVSAEIASEFSIRKRHRSNNTLYILVSQSGETADTIKCLDIIGECDTLGIVNRLHSRLAKSTKYLIHVDIGVEVGVASTKSFTSHLIILSMLFGLYNNEEISKECSTIAKNIASTLELWPSIREVLLRYATVSKILIIGKGVSYYAGVECALKIKELTYIPTEAIPSGELKHGHIALVDEKTLVIAFFDEYRDKIKNNVQEVLARGGNVVAFDTNRRIDDNSTEFITFHTANTSNLPFSTPLLNAIVGQILAVAIAQMLDLNVDKPRNLAKSVTVE
ncbi:Glutamine--fructose-6-phosphate aminotransferase [isomerizing] [Candidatus Fokinia solitaria]|uniref:Glutamine--fructose-6-phosphate aminotransferase [isomerizing] n=1 Tax=Candidatus Fokinia solitaria TaxID=1802984 RepID=A0A2U8BS36_9RICK|nr:glutamine--fructose-6-phosphate transaminase (isomerizing) [Candidatus Fokinia solitaria]AWD33159.1 Glutamine--fructose-6-phosphate aminotransferase [isomerizing] [Candidatus Fokinia solitaria]